MRNVLLALASNLRIRCCLVVIAATFGITPAAWGQSIKDVTVSGPVSTGNAFNVIVRATGVSSATQIKFRLSNCNSCTLNPAAGTVFDFAGDSQTYVLTINSSSAQTNAVLIIDWGNGFSKSTSSDPFNIQFVPSPTKLRVDAPPTASVGASFSVTVTALNDSNQIVSGFNNSVTVTSDDPAKTSLGSVTLTNGTGSFSTSLPTVRTTTITAAFTGLTSGTDTIQITPGPATLFQVIAPSTVSAGSPFSVTVNARDANGNLATDFSGTVALTSTDPAAGSLGSLTVTNGVGTITNAVLKTVGSRTITGTAGSITGTSGTVNVIAGQAVKLAVSPSVTTVAAGTSFSVQITAQDIFGNTVTNYGPTVTLSSTDTRASGMGNVTLTNGTGSFQTTHLTSGTQTITAIGMGVPSITQTASVEVTAAAATRFEVIAVPSTIAGVEFNFAVNARDQFGNMAPAYSGTVRFTSSDTQGVMPANTSLSGGTGTFKATLKTAGTQTIVATDTTTSSITGTSNEITVSAATLSQFLITAPSNTNSGSSFNVTVAAKDAFFNTIPSYTGPANITSNDGQAVIPGSVTFTSGLASFSATLKTAGSRTLTATDQVVTTVTKSVPIEVAAAAATIIEVAPVPASATAGVPFSFTVTAKDPSGNIASGYAGTLTFTTGDSAGVPPGNSTLTSGTKVFQATLKTAGNWTITATDTSNATITGTSPSIRVDPGPLDHFLISPVPTEVVSGAQFNFTVTAKDAFNNTVTSFANTAGVTSSDPSGLLPPGLTFSNGVATGQATLKTAGSRNLTVTASTMPPISAEAPILVKPGAPDRIEIVSGNNQSVPINTAFAPLVVRVIDANANPIPNWQITFAGPATGATAVFSPLDTVRTGDNGQASVNATANQIAGSYAVQVTASVRPERLRSTELVPFTLTNQPGSPTNVQATGGAAQSAQIGTPFPLPLVVTVRDSGGNAVSNVDVTFTVPTTGASATLSPVGPYKTDTSGRVTVNATANTVLGGFNATATVSGAGSAFFPLTNLAAPPGSLSILRGSDQSARVNSPFDVPLEVLVRDGAGAPVNDTTVVFLSTGASASANLSAQTVRTNNSGTASVTATANTTAGGYQISVVAATGGTGVFNLTNTPGSAANIEAVAGGLQSAQVDSLFAQPLKVRVVDEFGNPLSGISVSFDVPTGGASAILSSATATTDAQGYTSVTATANFAPGSYFVNARVTGVSSPASFNLRNLGESTATIVASGGTPQSAVVSNLFAQILQITVLDGQSRPIPNVTVVFTAPEAGPSATLSAPTALTDAEGRASIRASANTVAGTYQVQASAPLISAASTASFTLTNRAGSATTITTAPNGTPQSTRINFVFTEALRVTLADQFGNPVEGVTITYTAPSSGQSAQLSNTTNVTDAKGQAAITATANSIAGSYAVTASATGVGQATFNLTNSAGPPATLQIISGNAQVVSVGSIFAPLVVAIRDGSGNPIPGQTVTFAAPGSGASATALSTSASTDSSGQASFLATANTNTGTYTVAVSGAGVVSPVLFVLTNRAAAPTRVTVITGTPQFAFVGGQFGLPLRVLVQDAYGNAVSGVPVNFAAPPASGATAILSAAADFTGPTGIASVFAIANNVTGSYVVTAAVAGDVAGASFNLTNLAATSGTVSVTGGLTQSAPVLTPFVLPLTVTVRDVRGNPVAGVTVTFTAPESGASASLSERTKVTDSRGNVSVNAVANGTVGSYQVVATVAGFSGSAVFNLQNTPVTPSDSVVIAIVNAASFTVGAAPGALQTIFGANLASSTVSATDTPLPTTLGGVTVTVAGRPVPLLYVSPTQINFQLPPEVTPGRLEVVVSRGSTAIARAPLSIDVSAPGIFLQIYTDPTRAAALNADYTPNVPSRPVAAGGYVLLFMTGLGSVTPSIAGGQVAPLSPLSVSQLARSATVGPRPVTVQFAGKAPGTLGDQVNLQIPPDLAPGDYSVSVTVNGVPSNAAIISVGAAVQ